MVRTCEGGACVVVERVDDSVYVSSTLHSQREVFPIAKWRTQVNTEKESGTFDAERFFAGHNGFDRTLTREEIVQFGAEVLAGNYDYVEAPA